MTDERKPEGKITTQLPRIEIQSELLKSLERTVSAGFLEIKTRLDSQDIQLDIGIKEGQRTNSRLTMLEGRVEDVELRIARTSTRVQQSSEADLQQSAQLAQEISAREALAKKVEDLTTTNATQLAILSRLDSLFKNPMVKLIAFAIWSAVTGYLANKGLSK